MKLVSAALAVLLAAAALPAQADPAPTPEQQNQVENCKILSGAVFEFAEARDKKQSKMTAFKSVTHGQNYVPGSLLDETLQWAYAHPDEQPDTASGHFYARCVLDAYDARNPDSEGELDIAAAACQQGHAGAPDAIRDCINAKTQDIIARPPSEVAAAASSAAPAVATVVAVASPPPVATTPQPAAAAVPSSAPQVVASATPVAVPAPEPTPVLTPAAPGVPAAQAMVAAVQAPSSPPQAVTPPPVPRTEVTFTAPAATVAGLVAAAASVPSSPPQVVVPPPPVPKTEVTFTAPAATVTEPVVAAASVPSSPPQVVVPPPAIPVVAKPAPAPAIPQPVPTPAPVVVKAAAPQPVVIMAPLQPSRSATPAGFPPNLAGYGKLTVGMSMDDAYKALGSHGDTDYDAQGEVHTYMIGDDHGFMELRPSSAGTLYSIRVVGGADAHQPPVLTVVLGDAAFILINAVGLPSSRTPLPGDKELWNYRDRNYAWEISPGGDVIGLRIIDTGIDPSAPASAASP